MAAESHLQPATSAAAPNNAPRKARSRSPAVATAQSPKASSSSSANNVSHSVPPSRPLPTQQHQQQQNHASSVDHTTDGSPLEVSAMSDPAYKAYADLIANFTLTASKAHSPREASSHDSPPHDAKPLPAASGQQQQEDGHHEHDQKPLLSDGSPSPFSKASDQQHLMHQVTSGVGQPGVLPFLAPGSVPVAYFAGPGGSIIAIPQLKAKRRQVKNACTNCQKACKKCDEVRPCTRCVKYDLAADCVDSQRKERKKGVKRGPYKKREHKTEEEEAQSHLAAAAVAAGGSGATQLSILTPDNAATLQALGGIIYSYAPVQNATASGSGSSQQPIASGSGAGASLSSNATPGSSNPSNSDATQAHSPLAALSGTVPPPGPTAASYAFHPQFYIAPSSLAGPSTEGDNNAAAGSPGQSPESAQQQQQAQYYASIAAAYFASTGSTPGQTQGGGLLLPPTGSASIAGVPAGPSVLSAGHSQEGSPGGGPSSTPPASAGAAQSVNRSLYQMSPTAIAAHEAQAAADDPIERHHAPPPAKIATTSTKKQQQPPFPPQSETAPTKRAKGEKRKREKAEDGDGGGGGGQTQQSGPSSDASVGGSGEEQRPKVRPRPAVSVE